jgi:FtsP/CotA-like multicopper oxidase with cupredoxin domain
MALHFCRCATSRILLRLSAQIRAGFLGLGSGRYTGTGLWFRGVRGGVIAFSLVLLTQGRAEDYKSPELIEPPVCSPLKKPIPPECEITDKTDECHPISGMDKCHKIKVNLNAKEVKDSIGGYTVATENYNGSYLTPVIEALPGDTVVAHFVNNLPSSEMKCPSNNAMCTTLGTLLALEEEKHENATNLHYFHGGIVTPRNARPPVDAREGTGDNIYVYLKKDRPFELNVPIPGEGQLDARVLEGKEGTYISHPNGLDWYHSHLHGISSTQVTGGLSGLLSVGEDKAAVKAKCLDTPEKCEKDTKELRKRTVVRYAMLRDISLKNISAPPEGPENKTAVWAPEQVSSDTFDCKVYKTMNPDSGDLDPSLREGFCQRDDPKTAWLFTLNGQRFPTIRIQAGQNLLLRLGNLSSNVTCWLELGKTPKHEPDPLTIVPLTILALDGVVPARPEDPTQPSKIPVEAISTKDLLLMSASRAEIYIRNDETEHEGELVYVLRTKGLNTGSDQWPEIQLARIVLEPSKPVRPIALALNVPLEKIAPARGFAREAETMPQGCVGDLDPDSNKFEHRRVTFETTGNNPPAPAFKILTEIVHPPTQPPPQPECKESSGKWEEGCFISDENRKVEASFEDYELPDGDGKINWDAANNGPKHPCIRLDHKGSHKQLWVLRNWTGELHNFHIHQMKFRLATKNDLKEHRITPPQNSISCTAGPCYKLYDDSSTPENINPIIEWHDTIPVPGDDSLVFIIMSFDDENTQKGRFVYHCHILKHEDTGLMAPIEVWGR